MFLDTTSLETIEKSLCINNNELKSFLKEHEYIFFETDIFYLKKKIKIFYDFLSLPLDFIIDELAFSHYSSRLNNNLNKDNCEIYCTNNYFFKNKEIKDFLAEFNIKLVQTGVNEAILLYEDSEYLINSFSKNNLSNLYYRLFDDNCVNGFLFEGITDVYYQNLQLYPEIFNNINKIIHNDSFINAYIERKTTYRILIKENLERIKLGENISSNNKEELVEKTKLILIYLLKHFYYKYEKDDSYKNLVIMLNDNENVDKNNIWDVIKV